MKTYVLDTNIILDNPENIYRLFSKNENRIIIPETVIDEIDSKKTNFDELGYMSREFARILNSLENKGTKKYKDYELTTFKSKDLTIYICSKNSYNLTQEISKSIINDRKIIEVCKVLQPDYNDLVFISLDIMCRIRAESEGIKTETLGIKDTEKEFNFCKEIDSDFATENMEIKDLDKDYQIQNYNYIITESTGRKLLGQVCNSKLNLIQESFLNKQTIKPVNNGQKFFVQSILNDYIDLVVCNAKAGTGKTLLAISTAMRLIKEKKFNKIVYIRNSIESIDKGEDVGYLAGNDEKFAVFNHPLYDSLSFIAEKELTKSNSNKSVKTMISKENIQEKVSELVKKFNIETMWVGELRGRTISNAIVISDECLHKDQKIETDKGLLSPLEIEEKIKNNEWVSLKSVNLKTNDIEYKSLVSLKKQHISDTKEKMYKIELEDGSVLKLTGNHKLFYKDRYITVNEMIDLMNKGVEIDLSEFK